MVHAIAMVQMQTILTFSGGPTDDVAVVDVFVRFRL